MQRRALLPIIAMLTFLVAFPTGLLAASFDCRRAGSRIDKIICSDENLSRLDETMSRAYKKTLSLAIQPDKVKREQRAWIKSRNACVDQACVAQAYRTRIDALRSEQTDAQPAQPADPKAYRPYSGSGDSAVGRNENGEQMFVATAVILDHDNSRLFTDRGDFFWAPWMAAKRVDAMGQMAAGLKGREARITYSKTLGKSDTMECMVEGLARAISFGGKRSTH
ncbi:MAG: hypothetical protein H6R26_1248 [Proteobacteria bacterium]|nr:hypothetical protein [Pseudomonadota bacterium]